MTHFRCYAKQGGHIYFRCFHNVFRFNCQKWIQCIFAYKSRKYESSSFFFDMGKWCVHLLSMVGFHSMKDTFGSPSVAMKLLFDVCRSSSSAGICCKYSTNSSLSEAECPKSYAADRKLLIRRAKRPNIPRLRLTDGKHIVNVFVIVLLAQSPSIQCRTAHNNCVGKQFP